MRCGRGSSEIIFKIEQLEQSEQCEQEEQLERCLHLEVSSEIRYYTRYVVILSQTI